VDQLYHTKERSNKHGSLLQQQQRQLARRSFRVEKTGSFIFSAGAASMEQHNSSGSKLFVVLACVYLRQEAQTISNAVFVGYFNRFTIE
jgi:hypothetical protein